MRKKPVTDPITTFSFGRDQILARLWYLAHLDPQATRGSIAGQIKALSMIIAIEGLIPDRRLSPVPAQPAAQPVRAQIYLSEPTRRRQAEAAAQREAVTAAEAPPSITPIPKPGNDTPSLNQNRNQTSPDMPFTYPSGTNWVPDAMGRAYDADVHPTGPLKLPIPPRKNPFARGR